jgi:hypothetical protein
MYGYEPPVTDVSEANKQYNKKMFGYNLNRNQICNLLAFSAEP